MSVTDTLPDLPDLVSESTRRRYERWLAEQPSSVFPLDA